VLALSRKQRHNSRVTSDEIKQLLRTSAFRPFTVYADGQAFLIPHPEFGSLSPDGRILIVYHQHESAFDILDVALIARAEVHGGAGVPA
jgi:hypothetical protein